jgi:putative ABC transport system permease protein
VRAALEVAKKINLRHWREHRLRTGLTALGIGAGVALVIAVAVVNASMLTGAPATAERLAGDADLEVAAPDASGIPESVVARVASVDGVEHAVPVLRVFTELSGPQGSRRSLLLGAAMNFPTLYERQGEGAVVTTGTIEGPRDVMLAAETAEALGVQEGGTFRAEVPGGEESFRMAGTFSGSAVGSFETGLGVIPLPAAQEAFRRPGVVDSVYVIAREGTSVGALERNLRGDFDGVAVVGPPETRGLGFEEPMEGIAALTSLAGIVALFVAMFVVYNTMSMSIAERRREISLTLAVGASRHHVIAGLASEAAILGAVASLAGIAAGYFLARNFVDPALEGLLVFGITAETEASLRLKDALVGFTAGLGVAVLGAYIPARRVFAVSPVESLRPQSVFMDDGSARRWIGPLRLAAGVVTLLVGIGIALVQFDASPTTRTTIALVVMLLGVILVLPLVVAAVLKAMRRALGSNGAVALRLAVESLLRNGGRTTITVGALVFTLGIVVAVGSALDSYQSEWRRSSARWHGGPIQVVPGSFVLLSTDQPLPHSFVRTVEEVKGVHAVYPVNMRIVNIAGRQTAIYVSDYIAQRDDPSMTGTGQDFRDGVAEVVERGKVVISTGAATNKGLQIGDSFTVPSPSGPFEVTVGAITPDLNPLDSMYLSAEMFRGHWPDALVDRLEVSPAPGTDVHEVIERIQHTADARGVPVTAMTKEELAEESFAPIGQNFSVARGIQLAALIIAALAIANTMFITILERRWEFGLQRTLGMDGASLARTLLREAGLIGLIGTLGAWIVGSGMGYLMVLNVESAYSFVVPFELPAALMGITLALGLVISIVAGAYPSRAAFRTPIIEALRAE